MTNFGGFPYSFPLYFGADGGEVAEVGDMFLSDFDEELLFNLIKENPRSRTRTIRNYYTPQSDYPSTIKEEIGTKELAFSGFFDYSLVEEKHIRERKLDYFLSSNNKLLLINIPRDYATLFNLKNIGDVDDASFRDIDTFYMDGSAINQPLGQIRLAIDARCSTTGAKEGDSGAIQNRAVQLDTLNEYVYFNLAQSKLKLPVGNYEFIMRAKAEQADTAKMEVLNLNDTDEWANIYSPGAVKILCLKVFKEKLYAGTSDGKVYVSENGTDFSLAFDTGQTEVHCFEEYEDCLYAGTGNNGYIYKYDEAAWTFDEDTSETDVLSLKASNNHLYAGTGSNGKIFILIGGDWSAHSDLSESSIFCFENHATAFFAGTGANGKIFKNDLEVDVEYPAPPGGSTSGLTWDGANIWSCDLIAEKIYKHNADMTIAATYTTNVRPTGLAWDGANIWSCNWVLDEIYKHNMDATLSINTTYDSHSIGPTGLAWDGANIWSCNWNTKKIYKHNMDATLSINTTYDSPSAGPTGLAWDGANIWSCDHVNGRIYKHRSNMNVIASYSLQSFSIHGLTWDGAVIWSGNKTLDKIYKHKSEWNQVYDAIDTNIHALKSFSGNLYAGGDAGNVYKKGTPWTTEYATGEAQIRSLFDFGELYAGTGNLGKLFVQDSIGSWSLAKDLTDICVYAGETFLNQYFVGTGASGNIYKYLNGILASEQKTLSTAYKLYRLPFSTTSLDSGDTIRFNVTKDGSVAAWVNVDFLCFVATR